MADELVPSDGTDPNAAPPEGADNQVPEVPEAIVELARKAGWTPKEEFKGSPEKWRPADDYLLVGKENIRSMSRELRTVRDEVSRIGRTSAELAESLVRDKTAERDAYWQGIHAKAVEEGDTVTANKAVGEIVKLQAAPAPGAAAQPGEPPETAEFRQRHAAWLGKDPLATARAYEVADQMRRMNYDIPTQLREAERAVRKEFPELFPQAKLPAATQTGGARNANGSGRKKGFSDMPLESQNMAKDYLKRHGIPLEKTAESYWADASNHERKVG